MVLIRCEGCDNLHLIADNLGWFENDGVYKGKNINIETIMKDKGIDVLRYVNDQGSIEI